MECSVYPSVTEAVCAAKGAYHRYENLTLNERQQVIEAIKVALRPLASVIAQMTVDETGMGVVEDKTKKIMLAIDKTPGVEDLITRVNTGDHGMTLYELSAFGLVCAVHPCTNPCATLINNTIGMLAAGNAVIHCPHPRAMKVSQYVTSIISKTILRTCGIDHLVVTLDETLISLTSEVMAHPDVSLIVCTGGVGLLQQAFRSGKKVIAAGPANPVAMVDQTANLEKAARDIVAGATFDHNLMCTSEKCIVTQASISNRFILELQKNHVYFTNKEVEIKQLEEVVLSKDFTENKKLEGHSASEILKQAGILCQKDIKLIVTETNATHPFATQELMLPLVAMVRASTFEEMLELGLELEQGYHHTAVIHSESIEHLNEAAKKMQTAVFVKNGPSFYGIGFDEQNSVSFNVATVTGEGTLSARNFARTRRCTLTSGFSIR